MTSKGADSGHLGNELNHLEEMMRANAARTKTLYACASTATKRRRLGTTSTAGNTETDESALSIRLHNEYRDVQRLPEALAAKDPTAGTRMRKAKAEEAPGGRDALLNTEQGAQKLIESIAPATEIKPERSKTSAALTLARQSLPSSRGSRAGEPHSQSVIRPSDLPKIPRPEWHPPWKLRSVLSGHIGWVRALAVEPDNKWFASGAGDRTIKIWDLASGSLRLTLTGHISTVRGLAVSPRHPYLFSCGEDKMVKCWDLETNKVIRHYHGHLSGVYCLQVHPTLDVVVTGGRDGVARVWDMRARSNVHVLSHTGTVSGLVCQETDPQIITASLDSTVRLWDLAAGKTMKTITHHKKGVRAVVTHPTEFTFATASAGSIKQWKSPEGAFMQNFDGHNAIINTLAASQENILFSGGDNGSMSFWDWKTGHRFQALDTIAQPGSLDAESGIMSSTFDLSGTRLIVGEADKTIKIWKPDETATPDTHPLRWKPDMGRRKF